MRISYTIFAGLLLLMLMIVHVNGGAFELNFTKIFHSVTDFSDTDETLIIFREFRIPRTFITVIAGAGLSIAGLLMQTLFGNPLAGPSILGITSGSSLCVALTMLTGVSFFSSDLSIVMVALLGAMLFSMIILFFSFFVRSQISLLLIGMMLGSFTSAIIQTLQVSTQASQLKVFTLWESGSMQDVSFSQIPLILLVFMAGVASLFFLVKPLNLLVIGEKPTQLLGIRLKLFRVLIIAVTSVFAGLITAYCGPVSFIGLAVPNMVKMLYRTQDHRRLLAGSALVGACTLLFCDLLVLWIEPWFVLPLNGVTALFGAPVVIMIILRKF